MSSESPTTIQPDEIQHFESIAKDFYLPVEPGIAPEKQNESKVINLMLPRLCVPEKIPELTDEKELNFIVGIGGHHAPANVRLFSYVLPAVEIAQKMGSGKRSLTLATSVNAALAYNYKDVGENQRNKAYWHTCEKISFIIAFIREFFADVFSEINTYCGDIQNEIPDQAWVEIWNEIKKIKPGVCSSFLEGIKRGENEATTAYAIRHAFWFLDLVLKNDPEYNGNIKAATVSVGSEKEELFNSIRRGVLALPLDFLEKTLGQTVLRREKIFQLIFPTRNPVPYGEARKGKNGSEISAEVELLAGRFPSSLDQDLLDKKLQRDVDYTLEKLERLAGATRGDFLKFLDELRNLKS